MTSFLVANIYVVSGDCRWFSPFVIAMGTLQWTCWNALFLSFLVRSPALDPSRPISSSEC